MRQLMSQGEVRPGMVQGQHWQESTPRQRSTVGPDGERVPIFVIGESPDPYAARPEWIDTHSQFRRMVPSFRPNVSLSNREVH